MWMWILALFIPHGRVCGTVIYRNLGENECLNIRNRFETCGLRQFCSDDPLFKGCRNCSDIVKWCDEDPPVTIPAKYPSCEVICEELKRQRTERELKATGVALRNTEKEVTELRQTLSETKGGLADRGHEVESLSEKNKALLGTVGALSVVLVFSIAAVLACRHYKPRKDTVDTSDCTASVQSRRCCCFPTRKKHLPKAVGPTEDSGELLPLTNRPVSEGMSSGHGSGSATPESSTSDLPATVLPNNGTLHNFSDTKDFMQHSLTGVTTASATAAGNGAGAPAATDATAAGNGAATDATAAGNGAATDATAAATAANGGGATYPVANGGGGEGGGGYARGGGGDRV